ncbi:MAG: hypothetical protein HYX41_02475 [Bdellovibrio sp.]|nr:hypothetical protein [Bdellovibrio sp.]
MIRSVVNPNRRALRSNSGVTIVEVMIAGLLASLMIMAISETVVTGGKAFSGFLNHQVMTNFKNQISSTVASPTNCISMISGTIDPSLSIGTPQSISLVTPFGTFSSVSPNNAVGRDMKIQSISFSKALNLYNTATSPNSFLNTSDNRYYWPISGTITVSITNSAVTAGTALGGKDLSYTCPSVLTMKSTSNASPWSVHSCQSISPSTSTTSNTGWPGGTGAKTYTKYASNGQSLTCPDGSYITSLAFKITNIYYAYCPSSPPCSCACSGKCGCSYWCSTSCTPNANPNADGSLWGGPYGTFGVWSACEWQGGCWATYYASCDGYCGVTYYQAYSLEAVCRNVLK